MGGFATPVGDGDLDETASSISCVMILLMLVNNEKMKGEKFHADIEKICY